VAVDEPLQRVNDLSTPLAFEKRVRQVEEHVAVNHLGHAT
jgi:hypothetical protein